MNICMECGKKTESKFCSRSCSAKTNNRLYPKRHRPSRKCAGCDKETKNNKYCSNACQGKHRDILSIEKWLTTGFLSRRAVKDFIFSEQENKCAICSMENTWNGKPIVFILDHIDGNSENNSRENLRLVCPNCDSQLDTYKSKNRGNGRYFRRERYAAGKSS